LPKDRICVLKRAIRITLDNFYSGTASKSQVSKQIQLSEKEKPWYVEYF